MARKPKVIVGLGETGLSYARYLAGSADDFLVMDDAPRPDYIRQLAEIRSGVSVQKIDEELLIDAEEIYLSPGVPLNLPAIVAARKAGVPVKGDVQMFGSLARAPFVSITGTNGKSTVAAMLHHCAAAQRDDVRLVGNIGSPCLDQLDGEPSLYILEVSSYQLEIATELVSHVAVVLNLSPDHLDRYPSLDDYYRTKLQLYDHCRKAVVNRDLQLSTPAIEGKEITSFGSDEPARDADFGLKDTDDIVLVQGNRALLAMTDLNIAGRHNALNVLAVLAAGELLQLDQAKMLESLESFEGLAHRGEIVVEKDGIRFINDSKATNPGAMYAAIEGFANGANILLILGGETKGLDFDGLGQRLKPFVKTVLLIGQSREVIRQGIGNEVPIIDCEDLQAAVRLGGLRAESGDVVLLSPGCASFDEFDSYIDRGEAYRRFVEEFLA